MRTGPIALAVCALTVALGACSGPDQPRLMNVSGLTDGPDPFALVPTQPLEMPSSVSELPPPAPGGQNRADPRPRADAIAALGGRPGQAAAVPAADSGLIARATRFGTEPDIRAQLAAEDLEFRRSNQGLLLERWFNVNVYHRSYRVMALDRRAELERWRRAGARTPAAPPPE